MLDQPQRKTQREHDHQRAGQARREFTDKAHRQRGDRPEHQRHAVHSFGAEAIQKQAAGDLTYHIGPAERRQDKAKLDGREAELIFNRAARNRQNRAIRIGDNGKKQYQH